MLRGYTEQKLVKADKVFVPKNYWEYCADKMLFMMKTKSGSICFFNKEGFVKLLDQCPECLDEDFISKPYVVKVSDDYGVYITNEDLKFLEITSGYVFQGMLDYLELWNSEKFYEINEKNIDYKDIECLDKKL